MAGPLRCGCDDTRVDQQRCPSYREQGVPGRAWLITRAVSSGAGRSWRCCRTLSNARGPVRAASCRSLASQVSARQPSVVPSPRWRPAPVSGCCGVRASRARLNRRTARGWTQSLGCLDIGTGQLNPREARLRVFASAHDTLAAGAGAGAGKLVRRDGRWLSDTSVSTLGIPATVRQAVRARVGGLAPAARSFLQAAAVFSGDLCLATVGAVAELSETAAPPCHRCHGRSGAAEIARYG